MADLSHPLDTGSQGTSLQTLVAAIDRENAASLIQDAASLKERAARNIRRKKPHISFMLGHAELALSIDSIQEIGYLPLVTPLPNLPLWIKGVVQIRGDILSVVDFFVLFGLQDQTVSLRRSYILFRQRDFKFCLLVNRITGVVNLDELRDPLIPFFPEKAEHLAQLAPFFKGVYTMDNRMVHILDDAQLGTSPLIRKWQ